MYSKDSNWKYDYINDGVFKLFFKDDFAICS